MTTATPPLHLSNPTVRQAPSVWTHLRAELTDEIRGIRREPTALFFSVLMPVAFFALFTSLFGGEASGGVPAGTAMLATFGAYGVLGAVTVTPGVSLAEAQERGWLDAVRVSPTPVGATLLAKVLATLPYSLGILVAMTGTAAALGVLQITAAQWLWVVGSLIVGAVPMSLIGLTVGSLASPNATTAVLNAVLIPMAIAGGLWFPLDMMPGWMTTVARGLPTYHLAQLAGAPLDDASVVGHLAYLLGFSAVAAVVAAVAYRRTR